MAIIDSTDENFDKEVLKAAGLAVVQFSAIWCGPCQNMIPIMKKISEEMNGKVKFFYHDIEKNPTVPVKFGIRGVPTFLVFENSELKATRVGATSESSMRSFLTENI